MRIDSLYIQNMRNIPARTLSFSSGINRITGRNGEGKTTILEAIQLLTIGSSFRTHQMKDLVSTGQKELFVEAVLLLDGIQRKIALGYDGQKRTVSMNGAVLPSSSLLFGGLLSVVSTPHDIELIFGAPSKKRRFLDEQIAQVDPVYVQHMRRLKRALQQRNALLKQKKSDGIEAWEEQIATASEYISKARHDTVEQLVGFFCEYTSLVSEKRDIGITYIPSLPAVAPLLKGGRPGEVSDLMRQNFVEKRPFEIRCGTTLYGPQRDDIAFVWNDGTSIKTQASFGEAKAISLALRLAQWRLLERRSDHGKPIFLLDDLHSFFDKKVLESVLVIVSEQLDQVLITSSHE